MTQAHGSETNRLLGYPDDARLLILNADDFGMCDAINEAIYRSMEQGLVTSTSLMVPWPAAHDAMQLLKVSPELDFGVHLTVINDNPHWIWSPLTPPEQIPSLVDESGTFYAQTRRDEFLAQAKLDEVEIEFRAQIDAALAAGLKPTKLDWHCLYDGGRPDMLDLSIRLAKEHGMAVRVGGGAAGETLQRQGLPTNNYPLLDSYGLKIEGKAARYAQLLRELPVGLTEWAVHPGIGNIELQTVEPESWQVRQTDYDFVMSAEARAIIEQEGIILIGYRAIQDAWQGR